MMAAALEKLLRGESLSEETMADVMRQVADGTATRAQVGAFLAALRLKGETVDELCGAARVMRERVTSVSVAAPIFVDTCGTGGDGANTFNISTAAALVTAAAGVVVAKHGNRSVSSRSGSADVLVALGVDVAAPPERIAACIEKVGIGFLFAPAHHPAFKAVAEIRRELGFRTLFNLLGPLANPAGARHQVMGVFDPKWLPLVGEVLRRLGTQHALVVHGDGMDELALSGESQVAEVTPDGVRTWTLKPEEVGFPRAPKSALAGGDAAENAAILRRIFSGEEKGAPRHAVTLNAGAALWVGGGAASLQDGVKKAESTVESGAAMQTLERLVAVSRGEAVSR